MNMKTVILEIAKSGLIPLIGGTGMIYFESRLPNPSFWWMLVWFGWVVVGLLVGADYMKKEKTKNVSECFGDWDPEWDLLCNVLPCPHKAPCKEATQDTSELRAKEEN